MQALLFNYHQIAGLEWKCPGPYAGPTATNRTLYSVTTNLQAIVASCCLTVLSLFVAWSALTQDQTRLDPVCGLVGPTQDQTRLDSVCGLDGPYAGPKTTKTNFSHEPPDRWQETDTPRPLLRTDGNQQDALQNCLWSGRPLRRGKPDLTLSVVWLALTQDQKPWKPISLWHAVLSQGSPDRWQTNKKCPALTQDRRQPAACTTTP